MSSLPMAPGTAVTASHRTGEELPMGVPISPGPIFARNAAYAKVRNRFWKCNQVKYIPEWNEDC
jgi:hypothetical protein